MKQLLFGLMLGVVLCMLALSAFNGATGNRKRRSTRIKSGKMMYAGGTSSLLLQAQALSMSGQRVKMAGGLGAQELETKQLQTDSIDYQLTLATHVGMERIYVLNHLVNWWAGPISVAIYAKDSSYFNTTITALHLPSRVTISLCLDPGGKTWLYPINTLRNMAIREAYTTHFLMIDIDMLPSASTQAAFAGLSQRLLKETSVAFVVPAFEKLSQIECSSSQDCFTHNLKDIPQSKEELRQCLNKQKCQIFKEDNAEDTHSSTDSRRWLRLPPDGLSYHISCFHSPRYEPYVILRKGYTPRYDERFTGYGKNKIEFINHLRFRGFKFRVLPKAFLVHMPHLDSEAKNNWDNYDTTSPHRDHMDQLFLAFKKELEQKFPKPDTPLCSAKVGYLGNGDEN